MKSIAAVPRRSGVTPATGNTLHGGHCTRVLSSASASTSSSDPSLPGPRNAFVPGQEATTRRALFNRISPVYDEVTAPSAVRGDGVTCMGGDLACPGDLRSQEHIAVPRSPRVAHRVNPASQLNERLSFGQHKVWKRMAVRWSGAKLGQSALDVCCGSGDLALELARVVGPNGQVQPRRRVPLLLRPAPHCGSRVCARVGRGVQSAASYWLG
jgi:hypothetical protein